MHQDKLILMIYVYPSIYLPICTLSYSSFILYQIFHPLPDTKIFNYYLIWLLDSNSQMQTSARIQPVMTALRTLSVWTQMEATNAPACQGMKTPDQQGFLLVETVQVQHPE